MGASRFAFWRRIGLPILAPSLVSAFLLLFANAMGTYATAWALVGGSANVVTIRIGELTAGDVFSDPNLADALAMLLVISLVVPIVVEQFLLKPRSPDALSAHVRRWFWIGRFGRCLQLLPIIAVFLNSIAIDWAGTILPDGYTPNTGQDHADPRFTRLDRNSLHRRYGIARHHAVHLRARHPGCPLLFSGPRPHGWPGS